MIYNLRHHIKYFVYHKKLILITDNKVLAIFKSIDLSIETENGINLKFSSVVFVRVKVRCNYHSVAEFSSSQRLLSFLTV